MILNAMKSPAICAQLESTLISRSSRFFIDLDQETVERVSTGIPDLDLLTGGTPRGAVTEIVGTASSGRTSVILSVFAEATARGECVALIDGHDAFTPQSAAAAGVDLKRLLWIRCHDADSTIKTTDLILKGGGFGVVAVDASDLPAANLRAIPLAAWFRFQRTIKNTPAILLIAGKEPVAQSCAALTLRMQIQEPSWTGSAVPPHGLLFSGNFVRAEIIRCRRPRRQSWPSHVRVYLHS